MTVSSARMNAISAVTNYKPLSEPLNFAATPAGDLFGSNVFSLSVMKDRLPKSVFKSVVKTIEAGEPLAGDVADTVASAIRSPPPGRPSSRRPTGTTRLPRESWRNSVRNPTRRR